MTEQNLTKLTINTLTKSQYQALYNSGDISYTEIYLITDDNGTGVYALANNVYTKAEIDDIIANLPSGGGGSGSGVDLSDYYTKSEITALLANKANTSDLSDYAEIADLANVATSGDYNDLSNTPTIPSKTSDLTNDSGYVSSSSLSTVATSGSYNDLSNKPDLTVYETKAEAFSGDYDDLSNKPDLTVYQTISNAFSGSYNDLTDKPTIPTIPTNISTFTNDSGYQTASNVNTAIATALTGYATESYVNTAVQGLGNVFTIKGSVSTVANLPSTNNSIGDVYYVAEKQAGYIWIEIDNVAQWEELGETIDLSNYVQTSDLTWNNISSKPTFATVATSGSYADLTNKPTIPDAVSGTNDGTNWTSLTIGSNTYSLASGSGSAGSGSAPSNMVTTDTAQTINGSKTFTNTVTFSGSNGTTGNVVFTGRNPIKMTAPASSTTGFSLFNSNNYEKGYLQYIERQDALYLGRWSGRTASSSPKYAQNIGFLSENYDGGYRVLMPNKTSTGASAESANTYYIPTEITNGTTTVKASSDGVVNIRSLLSGTGGSTSGDYVTLATDQNITGIKTFVGNQLLRFKQSSSSDILGFTAYDYNNNEVGNLQVANRTVGGRSYKYVTLGNWSPQYTKSKVGFRLQPNDSSNSYNFVMPYGVYSDFYANTYATNADITIPCAFTDGTTTIKANASGLVDLSSLNLGGGSSTSGSVVTGTNDGTNWTSITINGSTYNIPAGGSSSGGGGSVGTGAIYYHNVRLFFGSSDNADYAKVIEFSMLTKSATQILTMTELISQVSALQNEPYNDSVVGVIYGQVYQYNNSGIKEQILGFGLTGTSSSPNFYAVVRNNNGRTSTMAINATNNNSFTQTIQWINNLQNLIGYERSNNCYDIVTGGSSGSSSGSGIVDINDIPLVEGELAVKEVPVRDEQTGEPLLDENDNPITEERLGISDDFIDYVSGIDSRVHTLEENSGGNVPTKTSDLINDSGFITSASVPSTANMVTTDTTQTISGEKTFNNNITFSGSKSKAGMFAFTGRNPIKMTAPASSTTGFSLFNSNNYEKGYLQYNERQDALYLGRWGNASSQYAQNIGFLSELGNNGYRVLMPNKTSTSSATATANTYYIPTEITNGTTVVKATSDGIIDISSLISGGGSGGGTTVSGTNDGTNWTSLTIGSDTYGLASGSTPANMVTTDTAQSIVGAKTFTNTMILDDPFPGISNPNGIYFPNLNNCFSKGLYAFGLDDYSSANVEGGLDFRRSNSITRNGRPATQSNNYDSYTLLTNGWASEGQYLIPTCVGFAVNRSTDESTSKYFLAPRPSFSDSWNSAYDAYKAYYIPIVISDGTTNYYANEQGIVTIPAGGSSYTAGTGIDITNNVISVDSTVVALKSDIPTVPTNVSAFTNDAGYVTSSSLATVATSGSYADLSNKPSIPSTATSTSTVTPSTIQLTFTFEDDTTQTVTLMTGATVSTTTTLS